MLLLNIILIIIISTYYLLSTITGVIFLALGRLVLHPFPIQKEKFTILIKRLWLELTLTYLGFYFVFPIYVAYDPKVKKINRGIMISNHLTDYDWLFLMAILKSMDMYDNNCIILKHSLSKVPFFGYAMKCFGYIFLKRKWTEDEQILAVGLNALKHKDKFVLLIFPEGTYITRESQGMTKEFAEKLNFFVDRNEKIRVINKPKNYQKMKKNVDPASNHKGRDDSFIEKMKDVKKIDLKKIDVKNSNKQSDDDVKNSNKQSDDDVKNETDIVKTDSTDDQNINSADDAINEYKNDTNNNFTDDTNIEYKNDTNIEYKNDKNINFNNISDSSAERILYNPVNTLIPRRKGFEMIINQLKNHNDGILDLTLFVTPHEQFPSEVYSPFNVFIKPDQKISFFCIIDYHEKIGKNFLFDTFYQKELMLEKYKNKEKCFTNILTFGNQNYEWNRFQYLYKKIYIWSDYSYFILASQAVLTLGFLWKICF
ncbi:Lysocardiolipin acyltransferase 1 [Dictyocoela muelleri]|nr:Lysocardiolipin acyltransferase 1 [Dictyocoela muelleri]